VAPSQAAPFQVAPSQVAPFQAAPPQVAPSLVASSQVAPSQVAPSRTARCPEVATGGRSGAVRTGPTGASAGPLRAGRPPATRPDHRAEPEDPSTASPRRPRCRPGRRRRLERRYRLERRCPRAAAPGPCRDPAAAHRPGLSPAAAARQAPVPVADRPLRTVRPAAGSPTVRAAGWQHRRDHRRGRHQDHRRGLCPAPADPPGHRPGRSGGRLRCRRHRPPPLPGPRPADAGREATPAGSVGPGRNRSTTHSLPRPHGRVGGGRRCARTGTQVKSTADARRTPVRT
jgi:hypothetical protein